MKAYAQHLIIAAVKYLDGTANGKEGKKYHEREARLRAIKILVPLLPPNTRGALVSERKRYWEGN